MTKSLSRRGVASMDRRSFGRLALGAGTCTLMPPTAWAAVAATSSDVKAIKDRGEIVVGMTSFDSAPFYFSPSAGPNGTPPMLEGWDLQLSRDVAQVLDVKLTVNRFGTSFNSIIDEVASGAVDIGISKLSITPRRAVLVEFSRPTIELRHALLANRLTLARKVGDGDLRSIINRAFDGRVGVIANSSYADTAKQVFHHGDIREYGSWDEVVAAVERGNVDLAYRDELEIKKLMRLRPELHLNLRSVLITDIRDYIAVAVPAMSQQLKSVLDVVLTQRQRYDANQLLDLYSDMFKA